MLRTRESRLGFTFARGRIVAIDVLLGPSAWPTSTWPASMPTGEYGG
ncbi:MAG: hypothetical protein M3313_07365 [Actinomycetota bacterium]|nr:hypothetical protein [Actinomycetota bacterium]